jgi:acyl-CoA reductase-like NAD-dependent aldehyde dehydrogenase
MSTIADAATIDVLDPATEDLVGTVPAADEAAAGAAVTRARDAFKGWRRTPAAERADLLKAGARRLREHAEELAALQQLEAGKLLEDSRGGVAAGIGAIEQYAELGPLHRGHSLSGNWVAQDAMVHEPRGVVVLLVPWNDPVAIACGQIAAALVTGNTVVFKPSEKAPLAATRAAEMLAAGLPEGVLEIVNGDARAGRALVAHGDVDVVMHTGSIHTGREIATVCAGTGAKAVLELGGKDALIVDAGVDPAWAAAQAASGAFANAGQICTSVERIYVHRDIADAFADALVAEAQRAVIGPLIDRGQQALVRDHVNDAVVSGARVLHGGHAGDDRGCFFDPTVMIGATDAMRIMREETFGPIAAIAVVDSFEDALAAANATEYGLAATVLSCDLANIATACHELVAGTVKVNAVWGGAPGGAAHPRRASGSGLGYGPELMDELTTVKVVHVEPGVSPRSRAEAAPRPPAD